MASLILQEAKFERTNYVTIVQSVYDNNYANFTPLALLHLPLL